MLIEWFQEGDIIIVDRGYRDAELLTRLSMENVFLNQKNISFQ